MTAGGARRLVPDVQVPDVQVPDVLGHEALAPGTRDDAASAGGGREDGRIMLLTTAFVAFALLLVTVVVSATEVHLERKRLYELADALALAAADSMTHETFYTGAATDPVDGAVLTLTSGGGAGGGHGLPRAEPGGPRRPARRHGDRRVDHGRPDGDREPRGARATRDGQLGDPALE